MKYMIEMTRAADLSTSGVFHSAIVDTEITITLQDCEVRAEYNQSI
jgi:hypothetical protein